MYCCPNCFNDKILSDIVNSFSKAKGDCAFCNTENTDVVPAYNLEDTFQGILDLYNNPSKITDYEENEMPDYFHKKIQDKWKLFSLTNYQDIFRLINNVFSNPTQEQNELIRHPVVLECLNSQAYETGFKLEDTWNKFIDEIKFENRFFPIKAPNIDKLKDIFYPHVTKISAGKYLYRGRVSPDNQGHSFDKMGMPPKDKALGGRANPKGIPYLYLSRELETALYETRATYYDYISIGEFYLSNDLNVLVLKGLDEISPFSIDGLEKFLLYENFLLILEKELSKPIRRQDLDFDYYPTQYLCEIIKSMENVDGVEYRSSLNDGGSNVALFHEDYVDCQNVSVYEINGISLSYVKA